jgi:alpha-L-arabinofuranosidase
MLGGGRLSALAMHGCYVAGDLTNSTIGTSRTPVGMWELADMCSVFGVTPIITIDSAEAASDMADFVEFAHGDPVSTEWGRKRASFGHPEPYNVTWVPSPRRSRHFS